MSHRIQPIHPFPARMATELVWSELPTHKRKLRVLDPMSGSGTTLVASRLRGFSAIGFDRDPLAVLISRTWAADIDTRYVNAVAKKVIQRARKYILTLTAYTAYPLNADPSTKKFLRYWFDSTNRKELAALAKAISGIRNKTARDVMWCAFSRLIITKEAGASLAMDVSHSRPHRVFDRAPLRPIEHFERAVARVITNAPFAGKKGLSPAVIVKAADARQMPIRSKSIDLIITSPPYLNAIDYMRGHRLSLVWMGYDLAYLRELRRTNVGTERGMRAPSQSSIEDVVNAMCTGAAPRPRLKAMLRQYVSDLHLLLSECHRVLTTKGKAIFVLGDCNLERTFVANSAAVSLLGKQVGFRIRSVRRRALPENRRYLPPPSAGSEKPLARRMREEIVLTMVAVSA